MALSLGESSFVYFELFATASPDVSAADFFYYLFYALLGLMLLSYRANRRALKISELLLDSIIVVRFGARVRGGAGLFAGPTHVG